MKTDPLNQNVLTENALGMVPTTSVRQRAVELALINGRSAQAVSKSDWEQAQRELTGKADSKAAVLESAPESERWDPLPGSDGHKTPAASSEDEDDEGRTVGEQLVDQGLAEAEHDQMLQATRAATKKEQGES